MLSMVVLVIGVSSGALHMVVGGGFFWESSPFPIGADESPSLCCLFEKRMVRFWVLGLMGGYGICH